MITPIHLPLLMHKFKTETPTVREQEVRLLISYDAAFVAVETEKQ